MVLASHALPDVSCEPYFFDADEFVSGSSTGKQLQQLATSSTDELRPAPPPRPKPFADIPLPPPARPLKWITKLADRATAAVNLEARYEIPPHTLYDLLADPRQHDKIFDAILAADAELLEESGPKKKWRLDYTARWNFWKVSGVCENRLFMWTDSEAGTVTFKLREPGFLKRYEGTWTITAGCGSPLAAFSAGPLPAAAAAAGAAAASPSAAASPANSTYDLRSSSSSSGYASSSSSGSSSGSRGSSPGSSPRSSWADGLPTADIFGANLSRNGSGASSGSSISMRTLPLATVSAAVPTAGIPQTLGHTVYCLGSSISSTVARWLGYSGSNAATPPVDGQEWPPLFKPSSPLARVAGSVLSFSSSSSSDSSSNSQQGGTALEPPKLRPMPTSAVILASTLTSPKLTPPYPLNALLKMQSKGQVEEMLEGLVKAAAAKLQAKPLQCC